MLYSPSYPFYVGIIIVILDYYASKNTMKLSSLVVKVSDLLKKPGKADELKLEQIHHPVLDRVTDEGICADLSLRSTNDQSIFAVLSAITYCEDLVCDSCGKCYTQDMNVWEYTAKFIVDPEQEQDDDVVFYISEDQTIDLAPMLEQTIVLNRNIANHCPDCNKKKSDIFDDESDDEYFESNSNVRFL